MKTQNEKYHQRWRQHRALTAYTVDTVETVDTVDTVDEGAAIYIVRRLGHHGNRLYGFMELRSKMSDGWVTGRLDGW